MHDPTRSRYRYLTFKSGSPYRRFIQENNVVESHNSFKDTQETTPAHGSYGAMLFRPEWKAKRSQIINRDQNACVNCRGTNGLQVHHRQYQFIVTKKQFRLPWDYPDHLLITLCETCHQRGHARFKVPTINI